MEVFRTQQMNGLLAECYWGMRDVKKAKSAFEKVYNPKNKKHLKKLYMYDTTILQPIIRPSKRAKNFLTFDMQIKR